jgi:hypothetical protein
MMTDDRPDDRLDRAHRSRAVWRKHKFSTQNRHIFSYMHRTLFQF